MAQVKVTLMNTQKQKVAFFDSDGTLFRWSLFIDYTEKMIEQGILPKEVQTQAQNKKQAWLRREGSFEDYLKVLVSAFENNIAGVRVDAFVKVVREALNGKEKFVYTFTRDLINELKQKGYFLVAISHSAKVAVDIFADFYGFDKVYGLRFEFKDDVFTGKILNEEEIFDKGKIVDRVLRKYPELTLSDSIAVGDTQSDIAMLEKVGQPIAFNPNRRLFEHAKAKDWRIVVERKDVIYEIN